MKPNQNTKKNVSFFREINSFEFSATLFSRKINLSVLGKPAEVQTDDIPTLPRVEVIRRLRDRLEPILLFGESEVVAEKRLRALEINEPDKIEGIKNDFKVRQS